MMMERPLSWAYPASWMCVELAHALGGVDDQQGDVSGLEMLAGHHDRKFFRHEVSLAFAATAGGVDEAEAAPVVLHDFVDSVARSAGDGRDDGSVGSGEAVQQRRLAHVGVADDGDFGFVKWGILFGRWKLGVRVGQLWVRHWSYGITRKNFQNCVQQIIDAPPVLGRDREHLLHAEAMKVVNERRLLFAVDLVDGQKQRAVGLSQQAHKFKVWAGEFAASVHDHDDGGSLVERHASLPENFRRYQILFFGQYSAGIDDAQAASAPFRLAIEPVPGNARLIPDDGAARTDDAVEECGLAYVRASHDGDGGNSDSGCSESAGRVVGGLGQDQ